MRRLALVLLVALVAVAGVRAQGGYGPPAREPNVTIVPAGEGYVLRWLVTEDADGWYVTSAGAEVWRARSYLDPGFVTYATVDGAAWAPGKPLSLCVTWLAPADPAEQCFDISRFHRAYLPVLAR